MDVDQPERMIRELRVRERVSQETLARRAGTTQAVISRIERGESSPSLRMTKRLFLALGYEFGVQVRELDAEHDNVHLATELQLTPQERLQRAFAWGRFNERLREAGRRTKR